MKKGQKKVWSKNLDILKKSIEPKSDTPLFEPLFKEGENIFEPLFKNMISI
jgi:hypothetical protein